MTSDIAENRFVPDCSGVVTARACEVNLLIERFEMPVYYYYTQWEYVDDTKNMRAPLWIGARVT